LAILKVARLGHPVLRQVASAVKPEAIREAETQRLIDDMIETMRDYDGVGIAAPQVHVSKQIAVIEAKGSRRYPDAPDIQLTVLINLEVTPLGPELGDDWEGCLSLNDFRGLTPRYQQVRAKALDREGRPIELLPRGSMRGSSSTSGITCWARCSSTGCRALKHSRIWRSLRATGAVRRTQCEADKVSRRGAACYAL